MANVPIPNTNDMVNFILRWVFAGFWGCVGWAMCLKFLLPHVPGL